jgi:hypothetical protein
MRWKGEQSLALQLSAVASVTVAATIEAVVLATEGAVVAVGVGAETRVEIEAEAEDVKASGYESGVDAEVWVAASVHDCVMGCYSWQLVCHDI